MFYDNKIWIGDADGEKVCIEPKMANRHGLIAGATGTGKTITLKVLAESFSDEGVPVFLADIKGDLSGMCRPGADSEDMQKRINKFGLDRCGFSYQAYPSVFWDIYGKMGVPAAQLPGPPVHLVHKGGDVPVRKIIRNGAGRIVGAGQQGAVEEVFQADLLPRLQVDVHPVPVLDGLEFLFQPIGDGDEGVQVLPAFQQQQAGHHLGEAGDGVGGIGVLFVDDRAGIQVEQKHLVGVYLKIRLPAGQGGEGKAEGGKKGRRGAKKAFHGLVSLGVG